MMAWAQLQKHWAANSDKKEITGIDNGSSPLFFQMRFDKLEQINQFGLEKQQTF